MKTYLRADLREAIANCAIGFYILLVLILIAFISGKAHAKTVVYGSGTEQVRIKYGAGPTIFRFSKAVQTITGAGRLTIGPASKTDSNYMVLAVTPRFTNGTNDVMFMLSDGSIVKTRIVVSPNDPSADAIYDFKSQDSGAPESGEGMSKFSEVDLLKAMIRDSDVAGYKISRVSEEVPSKQSSAKIELIRIYKGSPFNGYVFRISDTSWRKDVEVDVRRFTVGEPNLAILSQSDESILHPKGKGPHQTLVRVVAKNTASSHDVVMPMEAIEPNAQQPARAEK